MYKKKKYFAFLDVLITEIVTQKIQTVIMNQYLNKYNSEISFYSTEEHNSYKTLNSLESKLNERPKINGFIFYSFLQFCYSERINFKILKKILKNYDCFFVREDLRFTCIKDLSSNKISIKSFKDTHQTLILNLEQNFLKILNK